MFNNELPWCHATSRSSFVWHWPHVNLNEIWINSVYLELIMWRNWGNFTFTRTVEDWSDRWYHCITSELTIRFKCSKILVWITLNWRSTEVCNLFYSSKSSQKKDKCICDAASSVIALAETGSNWVITNTAEVLFSKPQLSAAPAGAAQWPTNLTVVTPAASMCECVKLHMWTNRAFLNTEQMMFEKEGKKRKNTDVAISAAMINWLIVKY